MKTEAEIKQRIIDIQKALKDTAHVDTHYMVEPRIACKADIQILKWVLGE